MSALLTEEQVLTVEETTPVLPNDELELLWFEALVEDDYRTAWNEALAYERAWNEALHRETTNRSVAASYASWEDTKRREVEWLANPMNRLLAYELKEESKRMRKGKKRLAA